MIRRQRKDYYILAIGPVDSTGAGLVDARFVPLPARPMVSLVFEPGAMTGPPLVQSLKEQLAALDPDAVVRVQLTGRGAEAALAYLTAARLRRIAPPSMNISLARPRVQE